jgi:hypothetical protein
MDPLIVQQLHTQIDFMEQTGTTIEVAVRILSETNWNLYEAINRYNISLQPSSQAEFIEQFRDITGTDLSTTLEYFAGHGSLSEKIERYFDDKEFIDEFITFTNADRIVAESYANCFRWKVNIAIKDWEKHHDYDEKPEIPEQKVTMEEERIRQEWSERTAGGWNIDLNEEADNISLPLKSSKTAAAPLQQRCVSRSNDVNVSAPTTAIARLVALNSETEQAKNAQWDALHLLGRAVLKADAVVSPRAVSLAQQNVPTTAETCRYALPQNRPAASKQDPYLWRIQPNTNASLDLIPSQSVASRGKHRMCQIPNHMITLV